LAQVATTAEIHWDKLSAGRRDHAVRVCRGDRAESGEVQLHLTTFRALW
jgi:hypothetical protein